MGGRQFFIYTYLGHLSIITNNYFAKVAGAPDGANHHHVYINVHIIAIHAHARTYTHIYCVRVCVCACYIVYVIFAVQFSMNIYDFLLK